MTVSSVTLMWSRNAGGISSKDGRERKANYKEGYQVVVDPTDDINVVFLAQDPSSGLRIPRIGEQFSTYPQVRCVDIKPKQESPVYWTVDIQYEGELGPPGDSNPLNDPPEISWGKITTDEPIDEDNDGNAIVTVNREKIEGVTKKISDMVLTVKRNYASISIPATHAYLHSVNSDVFAGFAAGIGRMDAFDAKEVWADNVPGGGYWEVTASVVFRFPYQTTPAKAWYARVLHEGYYVIDASTGERRHAWDELKQWVTKPVLLKANGQEETVTANANWLEFKRYDPLPYNALGLI